MDKPITVKMYTLDNEIHLRALPPKSFWQRLKERLQPLFWLGLGMTIGLFLGMGS